MFEAERLEAAAWLLRAKAGDVEACVKRLRSRLGEGIPNRWKGPSADRHWQEMERRCQRMYRAAAMMRDLAERFRSRARQLREEERRRQAAARAGART
jgi:uncharacterized protein YukE